MTALAPCRQSGFYLRFDWGPQGAIAISSGAVAVVVDVLSFTTTLSVAADLGVDVLPYRLRAVPRWCPAPGRRGHVGRRLRHRSAGALGARSLSAEAAGARAVYRAMGQAESSLAASASGRELAAAGYAEQIRVAAETDASTAVPVLSGEVFLAA